MCIYYMLCDTSNLLCNSNGYDYCEGVNGGGVVIDDDDDEGDNK